jgi:hypothetical protein
VRSRRAIPLRRSGKTPSRSATAKGWLSQLKGDIAAAEMPHAVPLTATLRQAR